MITIEGKFNSAIIYGDEELIEKSALYQTQILCDQPFVEGAKIRIMPDAHFGKGCLVGTTMTITDKVVPNIVGVDISCGMYTVPINEKSIDFPKLDAIVKERVPSGKSIRKKPHAAAESLRINDLRCAASDKVDIDRGYLSLGTLGGGNHFIEIDKDSESGQLYLVIHSGSRQIGLEVAKYWQRWADEHKLSPDIPWDLAWLSGQAFEDYLHDTKIMHEFATLNRQVMAQEIISGMEWNVGQGFTTTHNYVDTDEMIIRKGAISAKEGEIMLIPMNMRDGSLLCRGKGNPDWNCSAPHGAGRTASRSKARHYLNMDKYRKQMEGIYSSRISLKTLDESPMAYKSMDGIINHIGDTLDIISRLKSVYNFKAYGK